MYAENQSELATLRSSLDELRDLEIPKEEKITAWQRLGCFLSRVSGTVGEVGTSLLKTYLEELLKGTMRG